VSDAEKASCADALAHFAADTPAARDAIARILLQNGEKLAPAELAQMVDKAVQGLRNGQTFIQAYEGARRGALVPHAASAGETLLALNPWSNEKPERRLGGRT
jgi:hypothetical protein